MSFHFKSIRYINEGWHSEIWFLRTRRLKSILSWSMSRFTFKEIMILTLYNLLNRSWNLCGNSGISQMWTNFISNLNVFWECKLFQRKIWFQQMHRNRLKGQVWSEWSNSSQKDLRNSITYWSLRQVRERNMLDSIESKHGLRYFSYVVCNSLCTFKKIVNWISTLGAHDGSLGTRTYILFYFSKYTEPRVLIYLCIPRKNLYP
jgi:hypothetical protein